MASTTLRAGLRHRLIQQLAAKRHPSQSAISKGFTLIELLVVVIIIAILAAVALPGFLNQSDKAKVSAAKALVSAAAKECQVQMVEGVFAATSVQSSQEVTIATDSACSSTGGKWTTTVVGTTPERTFTSEVTSSAVNKTCTSDIGCNTGLW